VRAFVMNSIIIRPATAADVPFLWDMLFESAFTTDEARAALRSDPEPPPELVKYLGGWGRFGDAGAVAQDSDGTRVGAAWYRLFGTSDRGDGILAQRNVPELAIAVAPEHRGRRIGEDLLTSLARRARDGGYQRLMLSVDPANVRALRLYERVGFTLVDTDDAARGTSLIMQLDL
jgi:ribosomal protein S18 acetylase RimI-like enzyme